MVETYFTRRQSSAIPIRTESPIISTRDNLMKLIDSAVSLFKKRLLEDDEENMLSFHTSVLTNLVPLVPMAKNLEPETFALHAMENRDFIGACRYTTFLETISDDDLTVQIRSFLKRLHPLLLKENPDSEKNLERIYDHPCLLRWFTRFYSLCSNIFHARPQ